jgi:endo-1,4-beta-xylanase
MLDRRRFVFDGTLAFFGAVKCLKKPLGLSQGTSCSARFVGGQIIVAEILNDLPFTSRFLREFQIATPGRELKWQTLHPAPGQYGFEYADKFIAWTQQNSMLVRGHNLVWPNYGTPEWVMKSATRSNARAMLEDHIETVVRRYAGKIHSWDVLNEALNVWDKRSDLLALHPWTELIGPEYIDFAFHTAASADPRARLIWNQNYIESDDAGDEQNREAMLVQLRRLKAAGVPIHGIGIESHLFAEKPLATSRLERFIGEVRSLGLEIQITELDVIDTQLPFEKQRRDEMVADVYKRYLDFMIRIANPTVIVFWSLSDKDNWLDWAAKTNAKYMRTDGAPHRPGLLDVDLNEKAAYHAVKDALSREYK